MNKIIRLISLGVLFGFLLDICLVWVAKTYTYYDFLLQGEILVAVLVSAPTLLLWYDSFQHNQNITDIETDTNLIEIIKYYDDEIDALINELAINKIGVSKTIYYKIMHLLDSRKIFKSYGLHPNFIGVLSQIYINLEFQDIALNLIKDIEENGNISLSSAQRIDKLKNDTEIILEIIQFLKETKTVGSILDSHYKMYIDIDFTYMSNKELVFEDKIFHSCSLDANFFEIHKVKNSIFVDCIFKEIDEDLLIKIIKNNNNKLFDKLEDDTESGMYKELFKSSQEAKYFDELFEIDENIWKGGFVYNKSIVDSSIKNIKKVLLEDIAKKEKQILNSNNSYISVSRNYPKINFEWSGWHSVILNESKKDFEYFIFIVMQEELSKYNYIIFDKNGFYNYLKNKDYFNNRVNFYFGEICEQI